MPATSLRKYSAVALWASAFVMVIVGLVQKFDPFRLGIFLTLVGCCFTGWLIVEHVVAREATTNRNAMAVAIGIAVAEELRQDERPHLRSV